MIAAKAGNNNPIVNIHLMRALELMSLGTSEEDEGLTIR
jgi:hypothetical protein